VQSTYLGLTVQIWTKNTRNGNTTAEWDDEQRGQFADAIWERLCATREGADAQELRLVEKLAGWGGVWSLFDSQD
jgi:hypothetical protein